MYQKHFKFTSLAVLFSLILSSKLTGFSFLLYDTEKCQILSFVKPESKSVTFFVVFSPLFFFKDDSCG